MSKLRNLLAASLLTLGTVAFGHGAAFAETMTCKEVVDLIQSHISSLKDSIESAELTAIASSFANVGDPSWLQKAELRDFLTTAETFYSRNPQCREQADRAYLLETIYNERNNLNNGRR